MADPIAQKAALQAAPAFPDLLNAELFAWPAESLRWKPSAEKWSIVEVIAHLADLEQVCFGERMRRIVDEHEPEFAPIDPNRRAVERDYNRADLAETLRAFRQGRFENGAFLRGLPAEAWSRRGRLPNGGDLRSLEQIALGMAGHDANHLRQIRAVKRDWGAARLTGPEQALLPPEARDQLLELLERFPRLIEAELIEADPAAFQWKPAPDAWCVAEVVGHLLDCDRIYYGPGLAEIADRNRPPLPVFDQVKAVAAARYARQDACALAWEFRQRRGKLVRFIAGRRVEEQWRRSGVLPRTGETRHFQTLVQSIAVHDANHLMQIRKLRRLRALAQEQAEPQPAAAPR